MSKQERIERFMATSYLYFQLNNTTAEDVTNDELTEFFEALNSNYDSMQNSDYPESVNQTIRVPARPDHL